VNLLDYERSPPLLQLSPTGQPVAAKASRQKGDYDSSQTITGGFSS
jgi:hypothetical protein